MEEADRKKEYKSWAVLSISFCFMFFVFAPLEFYLTNVTEFWFCIKDLLPVLAVCFLVACVLLLIAGCLIRKTNVFPYALAVFFCIYTGLYIQGNYIPRNYGVLDGKDIDWTKFSRYGVMAAVLWGVMAAVCIVLCRKLLKYVPEVCFYAGTGISLILAVTSAVLTIQNIHFEKGKNPAVVTQKDMFSLSEKKNVIVLLYDAFDAHLIKEVLNSEEGDRYRKLLEDFTFYPDTSGAYPTTKASLPFILTGQWYENEKPYADYVREAYAKTDFYDFLSQNQYDTGVYTMGMFLSDDTEKYTNVEKGTYLLKNIPGFVRDLYKLAAFQYLPHQLKKYVLVSAGDFDRYAESPFEDEAYVMMDIPEFVDKLRKEGMTADHKDNNAFRFYHLWGTHSDFEFGEEMKKDGREYTPNDETKGCLQSLKFYCDRLKEKGIYEDSVIVVMADHGYQSKDLALGSNPIFMIKERQASHPFQISDLQVSWEDLIPTMKTLITGEPHEGDLWSYDKDTPRRRRFLDYSWDDSWDAESLPQMTEYVTDGQPYTLLPTSMVYKYPGSEHKTDQELIYEADGKKAVRVDDKSWEHFAVYGASYLESVPEQDAFRWTCQKASLFRFYVKDTQKNYRLTLNYWIKLQENSLDGLTAKINGAELAKDAVSVKENQIIIEIPAEVIQDTCVSFVLEFPNAVSPKQLGASEDARNLSAALVDALAEEVEQAGNRRSRE